MKICQIQKTYEEAITNIDAKKWKLAMQDEINSMYKNGVWRLVDLSESVKPVGYKWIFTRKRNSKGKVERYKIVAKGFT